MPPYPQAASGGCGEPPRAPKDRCRPCGNVPPFPHPFGATREAMAVRVLELHASLRVLKRSEGRSSVQLSAYITRSVMLDERTGELHDSRAKGGVELSGLVLQDDAPTYAYDRTRLWNEVEQSNRRKDAQVAREFEISFPNEFAGEQRREAALKIASMLVQRYGGAVEYALHEPGDGTDPRNFHAHYLMTTRKWNPDGTWAKKDSPLDERVGKNGQPARGPVEVAGLRQEIADIQNEIAVREQLPVTIEHLSFARRGLEREPQMHLGKNATALERRGEVTSIGDRNRAIAGRNEERRRISEELHSQVIQFEEAKARLAQKPAQPPARPDIHEQRLNDLYAESYAKRAAMLSAFDEAHGARERDIREKLAGLERSLVEAKGLSLAWRYVTGRLRQERDAAAAQRKELATIDAERQNARRLFEAERQQAIESLKLRQQQERVQAESRMVVGGEAQSVSSAPPDGYTSRRRAFFEQHGRKKQSSHNAAEDDTPSHPSTSDDPASARRKAFLQNRHPRKGPTPREE
jgi:hypothetical protein